MTRCADCGLCGGGAAHDGPQPDELLPGACLEGDLCAHREGIPAGVSVRPAHHRTRQGQVQRMGALQTRNRGHNPQAGVHRPEEGPDSKPQQVIMMVVKFD